MISLKEQLEIIDLEVRKRDPRLGRRMSFVPVIPEECPVPAFNEDFLGISDDDVINTYRKYSVSE